MFKARGSAGNPGLRSAYLALGILRWPLRPKLHQLEHLIYDFAVHQNPSHFSCLLDEDLIGKVKRTKSQTHPATMTVHSLEHYPVASTKQKLEEDAKERKETVA